MRLNIFRSGEHPDLTAEAVEQAIADYDPQLHHAPLTIGHVSSTNAPAWGWLEALSFSEPDMAGEFGSVDPDFESLWNRGNYRKLSASFYPPGHADNPLKAVGKDGYYVHHVAALGAKPPQIKGLQNPQKLETALAFDESEVDGLVIVEFAETSDWTLARVFRGLRDYVIEKDGVEKADAIIPDWAVEETQLAAMMPRVEAEPAMFSEQTEGVLEMTVETPDRAANLDEREREIQAREAVLCRQEFVQFAESELGQKLHPTSRHQAVELLVHLEGTTPKDALIEFSEGDATVQKSPVDLFKGLLKGLPNLVEFSEVAGGDPPNDTSDPNVIATKATSYMAEQAAKGISVSATDAVRHVSGG